MKFLSAIFPIKIKKLKFKIGWREKKRMRGGEIALGILIFKPLSWDYIKVKTVHQRTQLTE